MMMDDNNVGDDVVLCGHFNWFIASLVRGLRHNPGTIAPLLYKAWEHCMSLVALAYRRLGDCSKPPGRHANHV